MLTRARASLIVVFSCLISVPSFADQEEMGLVIGTSCDCPGSDPLANPGCGVVANGIQMNDFADPSSCNATTNALNRAMKSVFETTSFLRANSNLKSQEEVLDYISCYAERDYKPDPRYRMKNKWPRFNSFCHYKKTLLPQIALAAKVSGLPFAVQACLFFKESSFDPYALSNRGASGYVQFMPDTIKEMNAIVSTSLESLEKKIKDNENLIVEAQEKLKGKISKKTQLLNQKNIIYYEALLVNLRAQFAAKKVWDKYWLGTPNAPESINKNSVRCPQHAFALSVVKQTYDLHFLNGKYDEKVNVNHPDDEALHINGMGERDSALFLAGAYNAGVAGLAEKCGGLKSLDACLKKFPKPKPPKRNETRDYITSIRNCSTKDSTEPMTNMNPKKCEDYLCRKIKK